MMDKNESNKQLLRYAGLAMQFLVSIGLCVFFGLKADKWLHISMPLLVWLLPLMVITAIILKIIRETAKKK
jgi:hypothetical protein